MPGNLGAVFMYLHPRTCASGRGKDQPAVRRNGHLQPGSGSGACAQAHPGHLRKLQSLDVEKQYEVEALDVISTRPDGLLVPFDALADELDACHVCVLLSVYQVAFLLP